ncbi:MAG: endonuclease/exonuclease/phosphatase family protein [Rhodospirillales bacterium]|nr:endonuclease/exonuclease/phosphatase family protein [Rhodospirillales bacterium]
MIIAFDAQECADAQASAPSSPMTATRHLRVATYNIHRTIGNDGQRDPARIAAVIDELGADIIALQEVDWRSDRDDDLIAAATTETGYHAVAGSNLRRHRGEYGNLLLSRLAVRRVRRIDLSQNRKEPRGAIDVDLTGGGATLRVIATHFGLRAIERWRQAARLRDAIADHPDHPLLVLGDFNDWCPGCPSLRPLLTMVAASPRRASFPSRRPLLALDRILYRNIAASPCFRAHATPLAHSASDHLPVVGEIVLD